MNPTSKEGRNLNKIRHAILEINPNTNPTTGNIQIFGVKSSVRLISFPIGNRVKNEKLFLMSFIIPILISHLSL